MSAMMFMRGPKGRGGGKKSVMVRPAKEHGVGLVIGDVEDIVPQDGQLSLGEIPRSRRDQVHVQVQQPTKALTQISTGKKLRMRK